MIVEQCIIGLAFDRPLERSAKAKDLRGAVASLYGENPLFHQHSENRSLILSYPLIQYKVVGGAAFVLGIGEGAKAVAQINLLETPLTIGPECYRVKHQEMAFEMIRVGTLGTMVEYQFLSPWLALNAHNYEAYNRLGSTGKRRELLNKVLVGNIISLSKGIGYEVEERVQASSLRFEEMSVTLKGTPMLGFLGSFRLNFQIPDLWGIGKSVSRGFGAVVASW